eukprot:Lithocolla_globosa_v1_NODE_6542_length_1071_cov_3.158465.p3 type:complete len:114 gc:universal NODE_6542_length_1071_cov_3.158465:595-936(+)
MSVNILRASKSAGLIIMSVSGCCCNTVSQNSGIPISLSSAFSNFSTSSSSSSSVMVASPNDCTNSSSSSSSGRSHSASLGSSCPVMISRRLLIKGLLSSRYFASSSNISWRKS